MLLSVKKRLYLRVKRRKKSSDRIFNVKCFIWRARTARGGSLVYAWKKLKKKKFLLKKSFITKKKFKNNTVHQYAILSRRDKFSELPFVYKAPELVGRRPVRSVNLLELRAGGVIYKSSLKNRVRAACIKFNKHLLRRC